MTTNKFKENDRVTCIEYPDPSYKALGVSGTVLEHRPTDIYTRVKFDNIPWEQLMKDNELVLEIKSANPSGTDCTGKPINVGDIIVYFTSQSSSLNHQKARVEFIGVKSARGPHIRVLKEDAVQKDLFTRKSWLWSFDNSVKVG